MNGKVKWTLIDGATDLKKGDVVRHRVTRKRYKVRSGRRKDGLVRLYGPLRRLKGEKEWEWAIGAVSFLTGRLGLESGMYRVKRRAEK